MYYLNFWSNLHISYLESFRVLEVSQNTHLMPLDPFEGRIQFLDQLRHLSASQSASLKLCQFALKHRALHEDLYSCILEELAKTTLNDRVNIFYFLGTLVEQSERAKFRPYGDMIRRDLDSIVCDVAPVHGGAVNIPPTKKVTFSSTIPLTSRFLRIYWTNNCYHKLYTPLRCRS